MTARTRSDMVAVGVTNSERGVNVDITGSTVDESSSSSPHVTPATIATSTTSARPDRRILTMTSSSPDGARSTGMRKSVLVYPFPSRSSIPL